jgi:chemotaxis protein methyltransferase CheR
VALAPDIVAAVAERLAARAGLELPAWIVEARAQARIAARGCGAAEYAALLDREARELDALIEAVRVGESRLFRHRPQIDALLEAVVPALRGRAAVRVWSAGCAAGEEPYTLAMVLARALPDADVAIFATDVSAEALAVAAAASYPRAVLAQVPEAYRACMIDDGDRVRIAPAIARLVRFERANLLDGATPRGCDLVWCRNVLIYFTPEARRRAIDRLVAATVPGGFVFIGYSETLRDVAELDGLRARDATYYVRRARPRPATLVGVGAPGDRRSAQLAVPSAGERTPAPVAVPSAVRDRRSAPVAVPSAVSDRRSSPAVADRTPPPALDRTPPPALDRTPPPIRIAERPAMATERGPFAASREATLALAGDPRAAWLTGELSARLALPGLRTLIVDLDGAELLDDDLAPVLRRASAAARTAGIALELRASRPGARRWLARHHLAEAAP